MPTKHKNFWARECDECAWFNQLKFVEFNPEEYPRMTSLKYGINFRIHQLVCANNCSPQGFVAKDMQCMVFVPNPLTSRNED